MKRKPTANRVPVYVQLSKKAAARLRTLSRSYKLPQWAIVEQGIMMVKPNPKVVTVRIDPPVKIYQQGKDFWRKFKGPKKGAT